MRRIWSIVVLLMLCFNFSQAQTTVETKCAGFSERELIDSLGVRVIGTNPTDSTIALGGQDGIALYETPTFEYITTLPIHLEPEETFIHIDAIGWSTDGSRIAASIIYSEPPDKFGDIMARVRIDVWDTANNEKLYSINDIPLEPISGGSLAWSPNGRYIASIVKRSGAIQLWDANTGELVFEYEVAVAPFRGDSDLLAWSPDSRTVIFASSSVPGAGSTMDVASIDSNGEWQMLQTIETIFSEIRGFSWSVNNELVVLGGSIQFWDTDTWEVTTEIFDPNNSHETIAWSADGRLMGAGGQYNGENGVAIYNFEQDIFQTLTGQSNVVSQIQWSQDNQYIYSFSSYGDMITGYYSYDIYIWDVENDCLYGVVISSDTHNE